jgi:glycogen synthase
MRILMTADAAGGIWTYATELARALADHDVATTLAVMGPPPTRVQAAEVKQIPGCQRHTRSFGLEWMQEAWSDMDAASDWLLDLGSRVRPDIVHVNGYAHAALDWHAPVVVVGHSCVLSWRDAVGGEFEPGWLARYRSMVVAGLKAADWVVAPTEAMLAALRYHYGALPRSSVVPNGRSPERFSPGGKQPLVFSAARLWDPAKNIEAVASVARDVSWPVVLAGNREFVGASCHGFESDNTRVLGLLSESDMAHWLSRASIFAHPARYEPFGLAPLEAALSGCALVLGDIPSLREVWADAPEFVSPNDREALLDTIQRLMRFPAVLRERAAAARSRALRFTPDRMARTYLAVYESAAECWREARRAPCAS